jgi:hypothetical protein
LTGIFTNPLLQDFRKDPADTTMYTLEPKNTEEHPKRRDMLLSSIGQRNGISLLDAMVVNEAYCPG